MKNAIKVFCFVIAMIVLSTAGTYFYFTWDKGEFEVTDGAEPGTVVISKYIGEEKDVVIPKRLRTKKVNAIESSAFEKSEITSVTIGKNINYIGRSAFKECASLKSVKLAEGVKSIGESAFYGCKALENISVPSTVEKIDDAAFFDTAIKDIDFSRNEHFVCENGVIYNKDKTILYAALANADLSDYVLPETVNSISAFAFYNHKELKSFTFNDGIKKIYNATFIGCDSLAEIKLPSSVVSIESAAFTGSGLKKIYITDGTKTIDKNAFLKMEEQLTIVTTKGSEAEKFANENKFKCEIVDSL